MKHTLHILSLTLLMSLLVGCMGRDTTDTSPWLNTTNRIKDPEIDSLLNRAKSYSFRKSDSVLFFAQKGLRLSEDRGYSYGKVMATLRIGNYFDDINKMEKALAFYQEAKQKAEKLGYKDLEVEILKSLALFHQWKGDPKNAVTTYNEAIKDAQRINNAYTEAILRHNLGYVYWQNQLYDEAETEYQNALALYKATNAVFEKARTLSNLALNHLNKNAIRPADSIGQLAMDLLKKQKDPLWLSRGYRVMGRVKLAQDSLDTAQNFIENSAKQLEGMDGIRDLLEIHLLRAQIHFRSGGVDQALHYAEKAKTTAQALNDLNRLQQSYELLWQLQKKKNNKNKSLHYLEQQINTQKRINEQKSTDNVKLLKAKLNFDNKESAIIAQNQQKIRSQKSIGYISLALLLTAGLIIFLIVRNKKTQNRLSLELTRLNMTKNRVFQTVAGDLKTPVATLRELLEVYNQQGITPQEFKRVAPQLKTNVDKGLFAINNLFIWAQSELQNIIPRREYVALNIEVEKVCAVFAFQVNQKNIVISNEIAESQQAFIDKDHLSIILKNLIYNAIKYSHPKGKIIISCNAKMDGTILSIKDYGLGMTKEILSNLGQNKQHQSEPGTLNEKGTGIGVSICRYLLNINKARLGYKSEVGKGTEVLIYFD
ncbi:tetratricopeptide repeat-containing sensor histidine kinase [Croceitalea dokdonensis]|nr:tetratricopeptide repeat protein [Croceitalea dokdonensis]